MTNIGNNKENTNIVSVNLDTDSKIIVSLTSYPSRIGYIPSVLKTLYTQTKKPDKIILWLAEEQFPRREEDLPGELMEDVDLGRLDLRWCDDIGSHKKYFYAMQEFPDDIIIIVDDDFYYHPNTVETLYKKHLMFPKCIVGLYTKLILVDDTDNIRPCREWPSGYWIDYPSMQLVPIGAAGVLYPPHSLDPCVFDKNSILMNCNFKGVICGDDNWLKAHAILAGTPTVTQEYRVISHEEISEAQKSPDTIHKLDSHARHHTQIFKYLLNRKGSFSNKTVRELILDAKTKEGFLSREADSIVKDVFIHTIENLRSQINTNMSINTDEIKIVKEDIHFRISSFCDAMAYSNTELTKIYLEQLQDILRTLPNIDVMKEKSKYVRALMDYSVILLDRINPWHKLPKTYLQMLTNWIDFFSNYPEFKEDYFTGYLSFLDDMKLFAHSEYCKEQDKYSQECRAAIKKEWNKLPLSYRAKRLLKKMRKKHSKKRK